MLFVRPSRGHGSIVEVRATPRSVTAGATYAAIGVMSSINYSNDLSRVNSHRKYFNVSNEHFNALVLIKVRHKITEDESANVNQYIHQIIGTQSA